MSIADRIIGITASVFSGGGFLGAVKSALINEAVEVLRENKLKSVQEKEHLSGAKIEERILSKTGEKINGKKSGF